MLSRVAPRTRSINVLPQASSRHWSIRHRLATTVLVTALPLTALLIAAILHLARDSAEAQRVSMMYTARALAAAVDAKIDQHIMLGRSLATFPSLLDDDVTRFETEVRRALSDIKDTWVVVADLDGQQIVNTYAPVNAPLPRRTAAAVAAQAEAFEKNEIAISKASIGPLSRRLYASIHFPVRKDGQRFRDVAIPMMADSFQQILNAQLVPKGSLASITDQYGTIIARLPVPSNTIGSPVSDSHLPHIGKTGDVEFVSLEGEPQIGADVRTKHGWTTTVAVPRHAMFEAIWRDVGWICLAAFVVILASIFVASQIAGAIIRPISALAKANSLGTNEIARLQIASLPEAAAVAHQLARTSDRLVRSEMRLRLALDAAEAGTWEANFRKGTFAASERALDMHGIAHDAVVTPELGLSVLFPEDRKSVEALGWETYKTGKPFMAEVRITKPDGSIRWIASRGAARDGPDGRCLFGLAQDVTERRMAEETLRETEARLQTMFDALPLGVGMADLNGNLIVANREMSKYLPTGVIAVRDQSVLRRWRGYLADGSPRQPADFPSARALRGERVVPGEEMIYTGEDGSEAWVTIATSPILDAQGRIYAVFGAITDITDRKRDEQKLSDLSRELEARVDERTRQLQSEMKLREDTQAQLAQAQRLDALGKLTGGIAHDFNNLLTVIIGNLELADLQAADGEIKSFIQQATAAAEAGATINRRLLSFARRQNLSPQRINLNERVGEMHQLLRPSLGEKITLATDVEPELWPTVADPGEIDSAIVNIAINARDAMPDGGALTISTRNVTLDQDHARRAEVSCGDYVGITIADTGHGMTPDVLKRALEPFFTTKETGKGSGLGLSGVYGFVRQSAGFMEIDSQPGVGTTVGLFLPRATEQRVAAARTSGLGECRGNGELILVVEDDERVRQIASMNLESLGYRVLEASSGVAAKAILASNDKISLVFSDVVMPGGVSGYDLARWMQSEKPSARVLLASGHNDLAPDDSLRSSVRLLGKPYKRIQFAQALRECLERSADQA